MELSIPKIVLQILHIFTALCLLLDFCCDCYYLSDAPPWKIRTGVDPKIRSGNMFFYMNISILAWLILSFLIAVVEICLLFEVKWFEQFGTGIIKPIVILLMGIAHLGVCGDLGLASGILTLFAGVAWLIIAILLMV